MNVQASFDLIRQRLIAARKASNLKIDALTRRCRCSKSTIQQLEAGTRYSRADTLISYAQAVGLDIAAVDHRAARLLALGPDELVAIIRAAQVAADGCRLTPLQASTVAKALAAYHNPPGSTP